MRKGRSQGNKHLKIKIIITDQISIQLKQTRTREGYYIMYRVKFFFFLPPPC